MKIVVANNIIRVIAKINNKIVQDLIYLISMLFKKIILKIKKSFLCSLIVVF